MSDLYNLWGVGTLLESEGTWGLRRMDDDRFYNSVITHHCPYKSEPTWYVPQAGYVCGGCKEHISEKVATAWFLHNFDRVAEMKG